MVYFQLAVVGEYTFSSDFLLKQVWWTGKPPHIQYRLIEACNIVRGGARKGEGMGAGEKIYDELTNFWVRHSGVSSI